MAMYHFRIKSSNRNQGTSVSAAEHSDYINRTGRYKNYDQKKTNAGAQSASLPPTATSAASHLQYINRESVFQKRGGCVYSKNHLPKWADGSAKTFFTAADKYERFNGERYKEIEFSLPNELNLDEQKKIVDEFINQYLQDFYYAYAIHDKIGSMSDGERQPHVHIMFSTREIDDVERKQERPPELFFRQHNSKNPAKGGCRKSWKWNSADRKNYLMRLRRDYANIQNEALARNGINLRVDHRTLEAQREEALANGDYLMADLLNKRPEKSVGPVELLKTNSPLVSNQKKLREVNHQREQSLITRFMLQDVMDRDNMEEKSQTLKQQQQQIFALEHDIENEDFLAYFQEEKRKIQEMQKDMTDIFQIALWTPDAIQRATLDIMTSEEQELWQVLKRTGQEKNEWEILKSRMVEPAADDVDALEAYLRIYPQIDKELGTINLQIHPAANEFRPVFERLNLPHNKAAIMKRAAFYMNDNRLAKIEIRKLQRKLTANLQTLEKKVNDYFVTSQKNRAFSVDDVASILNSEISRMEIAEQRLAKELRADKRELKKQESTLLPEERKIAWQKIDERERILEAKCLTPEGRAKIEMTAAGILRKNAPIAKEYNKLWAKHKTLKDAILQKKYQSQRVEARAPLEQGNKFRTAPPSSSGGTGGHSYSTPSHSADLISKAIAGSPKAAQLVARSKPDEPDEWFWLSEAEKDDLRHDMRSIDRY